MGQDFYFRETGKTLLNNLALQDHIIQTTLKKTIEKQCIPHYHQSIVICKFSERSGALSNRCARRRRNSIFPPSFDNLILICSKAFPFIRKQQVLSSWFVALDSNISITFKVFCKH